MNVKMLASPGDVGGTWYFRRHGHLMAIGKYSRRHESANAFDVLLTLQLRRSARSVGRVR
jgi:hypothetical protein